MGCTNALNLQIDWYKNLRNNLKIYVLWILIQFGICCCSKAMLKCPLHGTGISRVLYKKLTHDSLLLAIDVVQSRDEDWYCLTPVSSRESLGQPAPDFSSAVTLEAFFMVVYSTKAMEVWNQFSFSSVYQIILEYID